MAAQGRRAGRAPPAAGTGHGGRYPPDTDEVGPCRATERSVARRSVRGQAASRAAVILRIMSVMTGVGRPWWVADSMAVRTVARKLPASSGAWDFRMVMAAVRAGRTLSAIWATVLPFRSLVFG